MKPSHLPVLYASLLLAAGNAVAAQAAPPVLSLEQAVARVQRDVGGTVLSAEPQHRGRHLEYRIKVLTAAGHVRVVAVPGDADHAAGSADSTKNTAGNGSGNKEKH
ncbi:PepSY domain-containing protein [Frateuria defendens]|uniref:PepSY domain-containing protein n=1 Tax=Frateuria defendens TaxID=2219559 RepID=UPI00066FFDB0|nr:PepSY domain-containing protein [Frateuria defendens]